MDGQLAFLRLAQETNQQDALLRAALLQKLQHQSLTPRRVVDDVDSNGEFPFARVINDGRAAGFQSDTFSFGDPCPSPHSPFSPIPLSPLSCQSNTMPFEFDTTSQTHGQEEVPVCYDYVQGKCARSHCKYLHDPQQIEQTHSAKSGICFDYLRGDCNRGSMCRFSHDVSNFAQDYKIDEDISLAKVKRWGQGICFDFVRGACKRGDACPWSHNLLEIAVATKRGIENMETSERNKIAETVRRRLCASLENKSETESHPEMSIATPSALSTTSEFVDWVPLWDYPVNVFGPLDDFGRPLHWFGGANADLMNM